jgi:hypothetical protein
VYDNYAPAEAQDGTAEPVLETAGA